MLKKVRITNFLSCKDTEIELDNVTALIGRNAAGKTNILKAIQWGAQFAVGNAPVYEYSEFEMEPSYSIEFLIDDDIFIYEIKIKVDYRDHFISLIENLFVKISDEWQLIAARSDDNATHYVGKEKVELEIHSETPMIGSLLSLLSKKRLNPLISKIFNYLSEIKYYTLDDEYKNVFHGDFPHGIGGKKYKQWIPKGNKEKSSSVIMRLLHLWHVDKDSLNELEELIGKNGLNLIDSIDINKFDFSLSDEDYFYTVKFYINDIYVNYNQLSYGTQRVLSILLALLYDKNSTLLIEQPEDGIHSGLLKKLLPLCFEYAAVYNKQIIIATHSPDAINLLSPESIRLVKMTKSGTKVSPLNKEQLPFIYEFLEDEGALFDFIESMDDE